MALETVPYHALSITTRVQRPMPSHLGSLLLRREQALGNLGPATSIRHQTKPGVKPSIELDQHPEGAIRMRSAVGRVVKSWAFLPMTHNPAAMGGSSRSRVEGRELHARQKALYCSLLYTHCPGA